MIQSFGKFLLRTGKTSRRELPFYQNGVDAAYQHAGAARSQPLPADAETAFREDPRSTIVRRHHKSPMSMQQRVRDAAHAAKILKHVTVHARRHGFANHLVGKDNLQ